MKLTFSMLVLILIAFVSCKSKSGSGSLTSGEVIDGLRVGEYRVGLYKDKVLDTHKITHIIVVGSAVKEDSDQFFQSGLTRAQRYKEVWPDHQVVIMSGPDVKGMTDQEVFTKYKIPVVKAVMRKFNAHLMMDEMEQFDQIASFDFYGHASPWAMIIGKNNAAFDPSAHYERLRAMRWRFVGNAYATLNACNAGFYLAPDLSQGLGIPVSGSLAGSYFERIESDGHWYKEEDQSRGGKVTSNTFSFENKLSCGSGMCTRMKAARTYYNSYWGDFNAGGLSFDKFFCNYENSRDGRCEKGMATSLLAYPSVKPINLGSDWEDIRDVVYDWLCSTGKTKSYFEKCRYGIENALYRGDLEYQTFPGNELKCDFISCNAKVVCKYKGTIEEGPTPGSCGLQTLTNYAPDNAAREFMNIMRGFEMIKR